MQNKREIEKDIKKNNFKVKKYFGQNFLSDFLIVKRIVELSKIDKETTVIEIGPGTGAMSEELAKVSKKLIAYEIDEEVIPILKNNLSKYDNFEVINQDIMKVDLTYINSLKGRVISVSNLPYYITSPIIDIFINKMTNVNKAIFMVQKEMADRICAEVSTKDYNAFSVMVQYYSKTRKLLNVPRTCFTPSPNVDSAVIEIEKFNRKTKANDELFFNKIVESSFKERRKTLVNNLSSSFNTSKEKIKDILLKLNIRDDARAEILTIEQFIELSNLMEEL